jgi:D-ribulokinase
MADLALGIDIGTSGVRAAALDANGCRAGFAAVPMSAPHEQGGMATQDPAVWWNATRQVLENLRQQIDFGRIGAIAVDGTSGTILGVDSRGRPVGLAQMYNCPAQAEIVRAIAAVAPRETAAHGATSALARAIALQSQPGVARLIHQADWISGRFSGRFDVTDENNALKTGYDPVARSWPDWISDAGMQPDRLPTVVPAGATTGTISRRRAAEFGLPANVAIVAGTTDGCAAFLATGAETIGHAVASLGTTLILKLLSDRPLFAPDLGIYSHRIGQGWLVGGASNSGGAAIARHFSLDRVHALSKQMSADRPTGLDYYPLVGPGERFPFNDPKMEPRLEPRPSSDVLFLQALMEGVANIERRGYGLLTEIGGPIVASIRTVGGGSKNAAWRTIRARILPAPLVESDDDEPAVGAAKLARSALQMQ